MVEVRIGDEHVLDERGFVINARGRARPIRRSGATNYAKVTCRARKVEEYFFFSDDSHSRARALDLATRRRDALAQVGETRLCTWAPCPGMPAHVRAINAVEGEE